MTCHAMACHGMSPPGSCPSSWPPAPPSSCSPGRWCWPPGSSRSAASCNNNNIHYKTLTIKYFLYDILASGYNDNVLVTYTYTFLSLQFCNFLLTFIVFQQQQSISVKYQKMIFPNFLVYENIDSDHNLYGIWDIIIGNPIQSSQRSWHGWPNCISEG